MASNQLQFLPQAQGLPTLTGSRIQLRWLAASDVPQLYAIFSDPRVMRYWSSAPMVEEAEAQKLFEEVCQYFRRRELFQWGIADRADDRVIGTCTLAHLDAGNRRAEIGYALGSAHWGKGLATEAVNTLLDFAFDELRLHRIEADVDPRNAGSIRALERQGFVREGLLRERWHVNGEICDSLFYGLLESEWRQRRAADCADG